MSRPASQVLNTATDFNSIWSHFSIDRFRLIRRRCRRVITDAVYTSIEVGARTGELKASTFCRLPA